MFNGKLSTGQGLNFDSCLQAGWGDETHLPITVMGGAFRNVTLREPFRFFPVTSMLVQM